MFNGSLFKRLSSKLLLMTVGFVMLAELLIFVPSVTNYRHDWLMDRAQQAALLAQALTGVPDYEASEILTEQFMHDTDVTMMSAKRNGRSEFMLGEPPIKGEVTVVDLRIKKKVPLYRDAFKTFFSGEDGCLRVLYTSPVRGQDALELIIPEEKLRVAMHLYFKNIFLLSIFIALITGILIYLAMLGMIIRPIEKLAKGLSDFREDPQTRKSLAPPTERKDEIGQLEREFHSMKQGVRASFKQRERLATLGMAVAKINHDLRNVLTSASLVSDRLASDQDERVSKMGGRLTRAIDRGVKLTGDVLNYSQSRAEEPSVEPVRIALLLGEAASDTLGNFGAGPRKINFINNVKSDISVMAEPDHTYRIFQNLFRNAAQAMAAIREDNARRDLTVEAINAGDNIIIRVIDTAGGMPDRAKDNLFKAFAGSTGNGNTGLGLTISKELAQDQNGDLVLERTGPSGTIFNVTIPAA